MRRSQGTVSGGVNSRRYGDVQRVPTASRTRIGQRRRRRHRRPCGLDSELDDRRLTGQVPWEPPPAGGAPDAQIRACLDATPHRAVRSRAAAATRGAGHPGSRLPRRAFALGERGGGAQGHGRCLGGGDLGRAYRDRPEGGSPAPSATRPRRSTRMYSAPTSGSRMTTLGTRPSTTRPRNGSSATSTPTPSRARGRCSRGRSSARSTA